jgi:hypothetical protein
MILVIYSLNRLTTPPANQAASFVGLRAHLESDVGGGVMSGRRLFAGAAGVPVFTSFIGMFNSIAASFLRVVGAIPATAFPQFLGVRSAISALFLRFFSPISALAFPIFLQVFGLVAAVVFPQFLDVVGLILAVVFLHFFRVVGAISAAIFSPARFARGLYPIALTSVPGKLSARLDFAALTTAFVTIGDRGIL